ncbi:MAG: hypothetical protein WBH50_14710 [Fuerstiella sp.]
MARQRTQNAISLFPFLAVLVCTMGALILLLLVTTRRIRNDQMVVANVEASETSDQTDANVPADDDTATAKDFVSSTSDTEKAVGDNKLLPSPTIPRLSLQVPNKNPFAETNSAQEATPVVSATLFDLRSNVDRLQAELNKEAARHVDLLKQIELTRQELLAADTIEQSGKEMQKLASLRREEADLNNELLRRAEELDQLQDDLELASKSTEDGELILRQRESALISLRQLAKETGQSEIAGTDKTIVEFTNATGTQRVPIIVDVTADGYEFLPSGIRLTKSDMEGFPGNDNPLLSAVMAVYQHRFPNAISARPYVLLLVRPDGSLPFYTAQRVLTEGNVHFGYELLEQDRIIDAGQRSLEEAQAARESVLAAIDRRSRLYGGLMAEVRELLQRQEDAQSPQPRQARVLPDGRIVMAGEDADGYDGKFYAGGTPKPTQSIENRRQNSPPSRSPFYAEATEMDRSLGGAEGQSATGQALPPENGERELADWMKLLDKSQSTKSPDATVAAGDSATATSSNFNSDNPFATTATDAQSADAPHTANSLAAASTTNGSLPMSLDDVPTNAMGEANFGDAVTPQGIPAGDFRSNMSAILGRSEAISGNMGVGGTVPSINHGQLGVDVAGEPHNTSPGFENPLITSNTTANPSAAESSQPSWLQTPTAESDPDSENPARDNSQPAFGWPGLDAATSGQATRTADAAESSSHVNFADESAATAFAAPSAEVASPGQTPPAAVSPLNTTASTEPGGSSVTVGSAVGDNMSGPNRGNAPVSEAQLMLQKFLQQAEQEKELQQAQTQAQQPDPFLLSLLTQSRQTHQTRLAGRYPVTVALDQNQLTIGRYEAIDVSEYDDQQILAVTLEGLAAEMDQQKPADTEFALPMVDFRIGRDAWQRQNHLARQLDEMNVPTRSVQNWFDQQNRDSSVDVKPPTLKRAADSPSISPLHDPAEPIEVNAPQRRNSI